MNSPLLKHAEQYCDEKGLRFTPPRQHVLKIVSDAEKPLGAYEILDALGQYIQNPKPPTAYRAIEFLKKHGFIHRIESLNAYVSCHAGHRHEGSQYMICDSCGDVAEIHMCSMPTALSKKVEESGFSLHHWNTELHGVCSNCSA